MTEKQYSKKRLLNKITFKIPGTEDNSVKEVKVTADFFSMSLENVLFKLVSRIKRVLLLTKQTLTSGKKKQNSLPSINLSATNLTPFYLNQNIKLPYYSNKENASLLADNVFFNFLIIQQTVA